ncbi:MAG: endo-1,4-beta-xylanase, partial [Anaerolineae bacterium]|nr:endo-1,4-beta-xylanase [Anaerolineae bacterium]
AQTIYVLNDLVVDNKLDRGYDSDWGAIPIDSPFTLSLKMSSVNSRGGWGSLKFYGKPKSFGKQWWEGILRMDIFPSSNSIQLAFRDGTQDTFKTTITVPLNTNQQFSLSFKDPQGKTFAVLDQNRRELRTIDLTTIPGLEMKEGLFPERKIYPGFSTGPHSKLTVSSMIIQKTPSGRFVADAQVQPGLRELATQRGIRIGTEWWLWQLWDKRYNNLMSNNFNTAIISDFSCPERFWSSPNTYDFSIVDNVVDAAIKQGYVVRASHLNWGTYDCDRPDWLAKGKFSREEYRKILETQIKTIVNHFKGRVTEWSVANEAIARSFCNSGCDFWADKIGAEYVELVLRWTKELDPNSTIIMNDTNNHSLRGPVARPVTLRMLDTVRTLRAKGVPVDAVGLHRQSTF